MILRVRIPPCLLISVAALALLATVGPASASPFAPPAWWSRLSQDERVTNARNRIAILSHQLAQRSTRYAQETSPVVAGAALAGSIRASHALAKRHGTERPPEDLARQLRPYFATGLVDRVRWTSAGRRLQLSTVLGGWYLDEGAVTLDDVVVFSEPKTAQNLWLWAHELTHVEQYRRLGLDGFAARYATHAAELEREADAKAWRIVRDIRTRRASSPSTATGL